mmetsp:Transcript_32029/g.91325  ORF Transcript_32029/g.91325 Transcript_32029/m.91325 type:complete len:253 (-) Transcript_32029:287-1045(-)
MRFCARQSGRYSNSCRCHICRTRLKPPLCPVRMKSCGAPRSSRNSTRHKQPWMRCHRVLKGSRRQPRTCSTMVRWDSGSFEARTTYVKNSGGRSTMQDSVMRFSSRCKRSCGGYAANASGLSTTLLPTSLRRFIFDVIAGEPALIELAAVLNVECDNAGLQEIGSRTTNKESDGNCSSLAFCSRGTRDVRNSPAFLRIMLCAQGFDTPLAAESKCSRRDTFWMRSKWCPCASSTVRACDPRSMSLSTSNKPA